MPTYVIGTSTSLSPSSSPRSPRPSSSTSSIPALSPLRAHGGGQRRHLLPPLDRSRVPPNAQGRSPLPGPLHLALSQLCLVPLSVPLPSSSEPFQLRSDRANHPQPSKSSHEEATPTSSRQRQSRFASSWRSRASPSTESASSTRGQRRRSDPRTTRSLTGSCAYFLLFPILPLLESRQHTSATPRSASPYSLILITFSL